MKRTFSRGPKPEVILVDPAAKSGFRYDKVAYTCTQPYMQWFANVLQPDWQNTMNATVS